MSAFSINHSREGDRVWIASLSSNSDNPYLLSLGLTPGTELQIISLTPSGSVIVAYNDNRIGLGSEIANTIFVTNMPIENKLTTTDSTTYLRDLPVGTRGRVVGYDRAYLGYMGRLLSIGLLPGTEFTAIRQAFFHYPLQIELAGNLINLRKQEADALCVEAIDD